MMRCQQNKHISRGYRSPTETLQLLRCFFEALEHAAQSGAGIAALFDQWLENGVEESPPGVLRAVKLQ